MTNLSRYFHTLKYLKPKQIYYRILYRIYKPKISQNVNIKKILLRKIYSEFKFIENSIIYFNNNMATFLNHTAEINHKTIWNDKNQAGLWLYNLHYFDALQSADLTQHQKAYDLLERWIDENPAFLGVGWKSFPLSLRIVNIIKYALKGNVLSEKILTSLYLQARFLNKNLEYHLLGNHLFENFKALCFAGLFFETTESAKWLKKALMGLKKEIKNQVLADGGHFELSPMYHSIFLEGLLDLQAIFNIYNKSEKFIWSTEISNMLTWLNLMKRSDLKISYFNDASNNLFSDPETIFNYADQLGYKINFESKKLNYLSDSGYIIINQPNFKLICDVGNIGPDFLPAHAHADTLSFELMIQNLPLFINLGTSCYGYSQRRQFERSTTAHNTVEINNLNSSDVWHAFRVAKRAKIKHIDITENKNNIIINAAHNGYEKISKNLLHQRQWIIADNQIEIHDTVTKPVYSAFAYFHLHPDCEINSHENNIIKIKLKNNIIIELITENNITIISNQYAESFGKLINTRTIRVELDQNKLNAVVLIRLK